VFGPFQINITTTTIMDTNITANTMELPVASNSILLYLLEQYMQFLPSSTSPRRAAYVSPRANFCPAYRGSFPTFSIFFNANIIYFFQVSTIFSIFSKKCNRSGKVQLRRALRIRLLISTKLSYK